MLQDGEAYGLSPLDVHVRRLIWHILVFLDIRVCEAIGPRPIIRLDDYDTQLPLNVDDKQLHASGQPPANAARFTDATLTLIRHEINEIMRTIWFNRPKVQKGKMSLTGLLTKVETMKNNVLTKYEPLIDDRDPVQKCAKVVMHILLSRLHPITLHAYHINVKVALPLRLRDTMVSHATQVLEYAVLFETDPQLRSWWWYAGALQQYHIAFLLLIEVWKFPERRGTDRIWRSLDYVFECDSADDQETKAKKILVELRRRIASYASMRATRAPVTMNQYVGQGSQLLKESIQSPLTSSPNSNFGASAQTNQPNMAAMGQNAPNIPPDLSGGNQAPVEQMNLTPPHVAPVDIDWV